MLQAAGAANYRRSALSAAFVALFSELILALPRNRQTRKLVLNWFSHVYFPKTLKRSSHRIPLWNLLVMDAGSAGIVIKSLDGGIFVLFFYVS